MDVFCERLQLFPVVSVAFCMCYDIPCGRYRFDRNRTRPAYSEVLARFVTIHVSRIKDLKKIYKMQIFQTPYISFQYKQIIYFDFVIFFVVILFFFLNRHSSVTLDRNARTCIKDKRKEPSLCIKLICFNDQRIWTEIRDFLILKLKHKKNKKKKHENEIQGRKRSAPCFIQSQ